MTAQHRQLAFQHWVAYDLYGDKNKRTPGQIRCPLLGCLSGFDDLESCLAHLAKCTWLSNAWYWCPFCVRPEIFIAQDQDSASTVELGQSRGNQKSCSSLHQNSLKPKSGAARFLKTVGGKLGLLPRTSMSRTLAGMHTSYNVGDQPQTEQTFPGITVAGNHTAIVVEKMVTPKQGSVAPPQSMVCRPGYSPRYSAPELEGSFRQPMELPGNQPVDTWYQPTAELFDYIHDKGRPHELIGSPQSSFDMNYQWPLPKRWPLEYDKYPGSASYSMGSSMSVGSPPSYTSMGPQNGAFPAKSLQSRAELGTSPNTWSRETLPKSTRFEAKPDNSILQSQHTLHKRYRQEIYDLSRADATLTTGRYQPSFVDETRDVHSRVHSPLIQMAHSSTRQPQSTTLAGQLENPFMMSSKHHAKDLEPTAVNSAPLTSNQIRKYSFVAQRTKDMFSSHDGPTDDSQRQTVDSSPRKSSTSRDIQDIQNQATSDSPSPFHLASGQKTVAALTSPTNSTVSSSKSSYRLSGASFNTQPTSAEATPIAPHPRPILSKGIETTRNKPPETSQCPHCPAVFKGTFQDRQSNLKRHLKYQHGPQEKFKCPSCDKQYSRPDNLVEHRKKDHQFVQPLKRNNARKVRRDI